MKYSKGDGFESVERSGVRDSGFFMYCTQSPLLIIEPSGRNIHLGEEDAVALRDRLTAWLETGSLWIEGDDAS